MEAPRILLVRLSAVGDVVNTLPAITALRIALPRAHLTFVVEDKAQDVVLGHPDIDEVVVFPRKRWRKSIRSLRGLLPTLREGAEYARKLRRARFDIVLDFQGNLKSGLHVRCARAPRSIGFARGHVKERNDWFTREHVTPLALRQSRVEKNLDLLSALGIARGPARFRLPGSSESEARVATFLRSIGCAPGGYVLVHPGTSAYGHAKRWPLERFAELARAIEREWGVPTIVAWGPGERALAETIVASSSAKLALETTSLLDLAELLRRAQLYVGADSGPLHLAAATMTPSVALFGPKDPAIYAPYNKASIVLHHPNADGIGDMESITVREVVAAGRALLDRDDDASTPPLGTPSSTPREVDPIRRTP